MLSSKDLKTVRTNVTSGRNKPVNEHSARNFGFRHDKHRTVSDPSKSDVLEARAKVGEVREGRCPWCARKTWHQRIESNFFSRDVFSCVDCKKRTLPCKSGSVDCPDMAAGLPDWDEDFCSKCGGWTKGDPTAVSVLDKLFSRPVPTAERNLVLAHKDWCSFWCYMYMLRNIPMHTSMHTPITCQYATFACSLEQSHFKLEKEGGLFARDIYRCGNISCSELGVRCPACEVAFAKCFTLDFDTDHQCVHCMGEIRDWSSLSPYDLMFREAWCVECNFVTLHQMWKRGGVPMFGTGLFGDDVFRCNDCGEYSIKCAVCVSKHRRLGSRRVSKEDWAVCRYVCQHVHRHVCRHV